MNESSSYKIKLPQFEGPFDLLLFFIERDELDIYDIPITSVIKDFMDYVHGLESLNIELTSEFILFASILIRIKARMLLPRKEIDEQGNEIDPRQELVDKLLEYKKYKQAALELAEKEAVRILQVKRGNLRDELASIGETSSEGTEVQTLTLYKLMSTFEKVLLRMKERQIKPQHVVFRYHYTTEGSRDYILELSRREGTVSFERVFDHCNDRIHAIFLFLSILELIQQKYLQIMVGEGKNNFIIEYREPEETDQPEETTA
ncbi:MAG TPA: segregation/condensation protein A [Chitinophagaceae bacterium]|nr:segregation/condensation protein A [Chitinophagaceae bacterium]